MTPDQDPYWRIAVSCEVLNAWLELSRISPRASIEDILVSIETADLGHKSVRRNPLIADMLHRIDYIEKAGTGINRMRQEAKAHGSPEPEFRADGFFTSIFRPLSIENLKGAVSAAGDVTLEINRRSDVKTTPADQPIEARANAWGDENHPDPGHIFQPLLPLLLFRASTGRSRV